MVNTPLAPVFHDGKSDGLTSALNMANMQLQASKVALDDARKYRRPNAGGMGPASRNVSGQSEESSYAGRATSPLLSQYNQFPRSPALDQFGGLGLGDTSALAGLGMNFAQLGLNPLAATQAQAQMLALAQAQQQLGQSQAYASAGFQGQGGYTSSRPGAGPGAGMGGGMGMGGMGGMGGRPSQTTQGRRSPMPGNRHSPTPQAAAAAAGTGGGAGGGAGVAGPDDVDPKVIEDTAGWLRVLRLHVSPVRDPCADRARLSPHARQMLTRLVEIHDDVRKDSMEDIGNDDGCRLAGSRCRRPGSQDQGKLKSPCK